MSQFINTGKLVLCLFLCFFFSCTNRQSDGNFGATANKPEISMDAANLLIQQNKLLVKSGDLIMRTGNDFTSDFMRGLSHSDKTYSHAGIASIENDTLFVYHAMGGEWNPDKKIRRDAFELFCNSKENRGFGIYRYALRTAETEQLLKNTIALYQKGIPFDMQFDLSTDDSLYCTEFIYKAAENLLHIGTTTISNFTFIAPDNLYLIDGCMEIKKIRFH